ncbi:hypothetical protein [Streptomyces sp. HPF1205]|uniref:hypothetical protein n=1 Tax=Streptomyces sp. HPF1205 TaxID=2873262 RepID=UPI001CEDB8E1|nr:hypothetical protein [Streptomyces sp. HPF1205]
MVAIGSAARGSRFTRGANRRLREARHDEWARLAGRSLADHVDGWAHVQRKAPLLVSEIESLDWEAERFLDVQDWLLVRKMILGAFEAAKAAEEDAPSAAGDVGAAARDKPEKTRALLSVLTARKESIAKYVAESAEIRARRRYSRGLALGAALSIAALILIGLVMRDVTVALHHPFDGSNQLNLKEFFALRDSLACIGGGSLGAALSVLFRIGAGQHVSYRSTSAATAVYRMILGWIFAAGILCLVKGHIVALFPDPTEELLKSKDPFDDPLVAQSFFFWVGVGILAGFNERWVKRLISQPVSDKKG